MIMNITDVILDYLGVGRKGVLATVVKKKGAAPREEGAKMFVGEDGKSYGTIGGGRIEADAYAEAVKIMGTGDARMFRYRMDAKTVEDEGMTCGGDVDVFLEPVLDAHRDLYEGVISCESHGRRAILVTKFGKDCVLKTLLDAHGKTWGDKQEEAGQLIEEQKVRLINDNLLVEPININPVLYVFGSGHVSQYLVKVAKIVDFNIVVIDDRSDFANRERFPEADGIVVEEYTKFFQHLDFTGREYVVIVTRGHSQDAAVLEEALKRKTRYIGMIGNRRKNKIIYDHLLAKGVSQEAIESVHAPIGINIYSETPQEIAVSIAAELIMVKRAK